MAAAGSRLTGAVLAGGASRRMGRPKALLPMPDGRTMIRTVADTLAAVCAAVVVAGAEEPVEGMAPLRHLADERPGEGPLAGIETLLRSGLGANYLVVPCDMPSLDATLLRRLAETRDAPASAFLIEGETRTRPLPLRVHPAALSTATRLLDRGERSVRVFVEAVGVEAVPVAAAEAAQLAAVNTPQQYEALLGNH